MGNKFKLIGILIFILVPLFSWSQEVYQIKWDQQQELEIGNGLTVNYIKAPGSGTFVMLGGLNNLDGSGNFFRLFGAKMIIDSMSRNGNGTYHVVIRREDGLDLFDRFPSLQATLIPSQLVNTDAPEIVNPVE